MPTTMIGDPHQFAIEYELLNHRPPFGHIRLWLDGKWFGQLERTMYLYHMAHMLQTILPPHDLGMCLVFSTLEDAPSDEEVLRSTSWSWGDSFDDYFFMIYVVEAERTVHFIWQLEAASLDSFPDYPLGPHHASVTMSTFVRVIGQYLDALGNP